ncbi:MAG TPA: polysaccharide biosynthesis/export family protein [Acidisarcina sp.]
MILKSCLPALVLLASCPIACVAQRTLIRSSDVTSADRTSQSAQPHSSLVPADSRAFQVGAGDVLGITVWDEPQLTTRAVVRPDGFISMPLLDPIKVIGLTPEQVQKLLTERVTEIVKHPRVSVVVQEIHSRIVYITGEVHHPGAYPLLGSINVMQLIARSGGITEYAHHKQIFVVRQNTGQKMKVNYDRLLKGEDSEEDIALLPGDMVVIP